MDKKNKLSPVTITLHWLVGLTVLFLCGLGLYMTNWELYQHYDLHKSIGVIAAAVILLRVVWRIKQGWPEPVRDYEKIEQLLSKTTHWVLILAMVAMPITGMMYSAFSGHGFGIFGLEIVHGNHDTTDPSVVIPYSQYWSDFGQTAHHYVGYLFIAAIVLHVSGALKHHLIDKDNTLNRMFGREVG